jgi:protein-S-isoprenylcysteine O-methyltransferase Ste14
MMKAVRAVLYFLYTMILYLGYPLLGWGLRDVRGFFALPQRAAYAVVVALLGVGAGWQGMRSPEGLRGGPWEAGKRVRRQTIVRYAIVLALYAALLFLPFADRRGIAVLPAHATLRWVGVVLFGLGCLCIFWSGVALGRLYSPEVTIQKDHHLVTVGPYCYIRHPRYLGACLLAVGLALVFRSWIGLAAIVPFLAVLLLRIRDEEALMHAEFGQEWEAYARRSWRLIPFVF